MTVTFLKRAGRNPARFLFLACVILCCSSSILEAQWAQDSTTNTPVCVSAGVQELPAACSDGSNGAVIAWQDSRTGTSAIYAQRLDSNGREMWRHNGVLLSTDAATSQLPPVIAADGNGGAYVAWQRGGSKYFAQHIQGDGSLGYSSTGIQVAAGGSNFVMCSDGKGGAFAAWDYNSDVYANHLLGGSVGFGSSGKTIDASKSYQRLPAICDDGTGGCFIAWQSGSSIPYAIFANRLDASGNALWNAPGILVYKAVCGGCTGVNAGHVAVQRDGQQLMLAWEVTSTNSADSQNIMATRIRCSTKTDTTFVWGKAIDVTGEMLYSQTVPQIFSDDAPTILGNDFRGILVPFQNQKPGASDDYDISMIRILGDGTTAMPGSYSAYDFAAQPHGQVGFRAIKIDTALLAVWNDARFNGMGSDTCIYVQLMDKNGRKRFPSYGTTSKWGKPICQGNWTAKQVTIAPRTNGAIVAWTDFRAGTNDPNIYAQIIMKDGALTNGNYQWDFGDPTVKVISRVGSSDTSQCNARCTHVVAVDSGSHQSGIRSVVATFANNMVLTVPNFAPGVPSVPYSICVLDSMSNGSATVTIADTSANVSTATYSYCTIPDTLAPAIQWDTVANWIQFFIRDNRPWDRGLSSIVVTDSQNISFYPSLGQVTPGVGTYKTVASQIDQSKPSRFRISVRDTAGNVSQEYAFEKQGTAGVGGGESSNVTIAVFPNPISGLTSICLQGAASAKFTVFDVLGHEIEHFTVENTYGWQTSALAAGTYILRAEVDGHILSKRVVRE